MGHTSVFGVLCLVCCVRFAVFEKYKNVAGSTNLCGVWAKGDNVREGRTGGGCAESAWTTEGNVVVRGRGCVAGVLHDDKVRAVRRDLPQREVAESRRVGPQPRPCCPLSHLQPQPGRLCLGLWSPRERLI